MGRELYATEANKNGLLSMYYLPVTILRNLQVLSHLILPEDTINYPHFDKETYKVKYLVQHHAGEKWQNRE